MLKDILAVIAGIILGGLVNMGIILLSPSIIPPPEGVDVMDPDSIKSAMHLFQPRHFIFPFLAHALGSLAGALACAKIASDRRLTLALVVGLFFLAGGIYNTFVLPAPAWFVALDLIVAYVPMAWLGARLAGVR